MIRSFRVSTSVSGNGRGCARLAPAFDLLAIDDDELGEEWSRFGLSEANKAVSSASASVFDG